MSNDNSTFITSIHKCVHKFKYFIQPFDKMNSICSVPEPNSYFFYRKCFRKLLDLYPYSISKVRK